MMGCGVGGGGGGGRKALNRVAMNIKDLYSCRKGEEEKRKEKKREKKMERVSSSL